MKIKKKLNHQINENILDPEVLVVGNGIEKSVMSIRDALSLASSQNLDLVKVFPGAKPPVCKIMDYGKFCFEEKKKKKEAKKKQKTVEVKEIKLSVRIDVGDLMTKVNRANDFISSGNKVKVSVKLKGRQSSDQGFDVLNRFSDLCKEFASLDGKPISEGRQISLILSPIDKKIKGSTITKAVVRENQKSVDSDLHEEKARTLPN